MIIWIVCLLCIVAGIWKLGWMMVPTLTSIMVKDLLRNSHWHVRCNFNDGIHCEIYYSIIRWGAPCPELACRIVVHHSTSCWVARLMIMVQVVFTLYLAQEHNIMVMQPNFCTNGSPIWIRSSRLIFHNLGLNCHYENPPK